MLIRLQKASKDDLTCVHVTWHECVTLLLSASNLKTIAAEGCYALLVDAREGAVHCLDAHVPASTVCFACLMICGYVQICEPCAVL